jgi:hypothetical protein
MRKYSLWLTTVSLFALIAAILTQTRVTSVSPQTPVLSVIRGRNWAYSVPFHVKNAAAIQKLISCESQGVNIIKPDSDGIVSAGILQFHQDGTWQDMERLSGFTGSSIFPSDAILMADWMISHGLGHRWTCWHLTGLDVPGPIERIWEFFHSP